MSFGVVADVHGNFEALQPDDPPRRRGWCSVSATLRAGPGVPTSDAALLDPGNNENTTAIDS